MALLTRSIRLALIKRQENHIPAISLTDIVRMTKSAREHGK